MRRKGNSANLKNLDKFKEIFESWRAKNFKTPAVWKISKINFWRRQMASSLSTSQFKEHKSPGSPLPLWPQRNRATRPSHLSQAVQVQWKWTGERGFFCPPLLPFMPKSSFPSAVLPRLFYISGSQESAAKSAQSLIMWTSTYNYRE